MPKPRHTVSAIPGTRAAYARGCRCDLCASQGRAANALYGREYRAGIRGAEGRANHKSRPVIYTAAELASITGAG